MGLVVLVPSIDGKIEPACDERLRMLERRGIEVRRSIGCASIDFARSILATKALADGFDEILWIDDDVVFEVDDVDRVRSNEQALVAGPCAKRGVHAFALDVLPGTKSLTFGTEGGISEVMFVGTGFMFTRRALYEAIAKELPVCRRGSSNVVPYFIPFILRRDDEHLYLGEDYAFCERARRAGFPVLVDTRIRLFHIGAHPYGWEEAGGYGVPRASSFVCNFE